MDGSTGFGRRGVLLLGAMAVLGACTWVPRDADNESDSGGLRTDLKPLEDRFATLGPLSGAHWLGITLGGDSRLSAPGPTDARVVGIAQLKAGAVAAILKAPKWDFQPDTPSEPPGDLADFLPKGASWVRSDSFDSASRGTAKGAFYLDRNTNSVYFDVYYL